MKRMLSAGGDIGQAGELSLDPQGLPQVFNQRWYGVDDNAPVLSGNLSVLSGNSVTLTIDNFDAFSTYQVTFNDEPLTLLENTLTFTPSSGGKLVVVSTFGTTQLTVEVSYPDVSGAFTQLSAGPGTRQSHNGVVIDNELYIVGGKDTGAYNATEISDLWHYNADQDNWSVITPTTSSARTGQSAGAVGDTIYMFSGFLIRSAASYSLTNGGWNSIYFRPEWRQYSTTVDYQDKLYIFAGKGNANTLSDFWEYTPATATTEEIWRELPKRPGARYGHTAVVIDDQMIVFGGSNSSYFNDTWAYNFTTNSWNQLADGPGGRRYHCAAVANGKMYVYGGYGGNYLDELWVYDPITNVWTLLGNGAAPRIYASLNNLNGKLYLFGGYLASPSTYYDDLWLIE